jgi:hypothetical protein
VTTYGRSSELARGPRSDARRRIWAALLFRAVKTNKERSEFFITFPGTGVTLMTNPSPSVTQAFA